MIPGDQQLAMLGKAFGGFDSQCRCHRVEVFSGENRAYYRNDANFLEDTGSVKFDALQIRPRRRLTAHDDKFPCLGVVWCGSPGQQRAGRAIVGDVRLKGWPRAA